jgi:hypothetical protein
MATIRIAFVQLAPCLRALQANRRLIDRDLIPGPRHAGQLPPVWVLFLE